MCLDPGHPGSRRFSFFDADKMEEKEMEQFKCELEQAVKDDNIQLVNFFLQREPDVFASLFKDEEGWGIIEFASRGNKPKN